MTTNGKGDRRRPRAISSTEESDRWHATFRRTQKPTPEQARVLAEYIEVEGELTGDEIRITLDKS